MKLSEMNFEQIKEDWVKRDQWDTHPESHIDIQWLIAEVERLREEVAAAKAWAPWW